MGELNDLADEIERRELKFADVVAGHYEMLSADELALIVSLLRANDEPTAEEVAELNRRFPRGLTDMIDRVTPTDTPLMRVLKRS